VPEIKPCMKGGSQTDSRVPVPEGHYTDPSMRATVSPNRNMILLSLAGAVAISHGCSTLAYAAHAGDHPIYPDCHPLFFDAMTEAFRLCHYEPLQFEAPFIHLTKAEIVAKGHKLGVPFELTWSCYKGEDLHCGKCGTCYQRKEAFQIAGVEDATPYEDEEANA
jgi:7-cyano-7-deazaguanine synthase